MKIRAIENVYGLTKDKIYDVIKEEENFYEIIEDHGNERSYLKWRFEIVEELPEKWRIRQNSSEDVCKWFNNFPNSKIGGAFIGGGYEFLCFDSIKKETSYGYKSGIIKDYTEISLEQFQKLVLKENLNETKMKIIGYTLLKDSVENKAGAFYIKESNYVCREANYHSLEPKFVENNPEWFSAVYGEKYTEGEWVVITQDHKDYNNGKYQNAIGKYISNKPPNDEYKFYIDVPGEGRLACMEIRKATKEEIEKATKVVINDYTAKKEGELIAFGCQKFTSNELMAYKKLLNSTINAQINIHGVNVTEEMLDKLLAL